MDIIKKVVSKDKKFFGGGNKGEFCWSGNNG